MTSRVGWLVLGLTMASCGASLPQQGNDGGGGTTGAAMGDAGTTGGGGAVAGAGGVGGVGGAGGRRGSRIFGVAGVGGTAALVECSRLDPLPQMVAVGADGMEPRMSANAAVTIVSVDSCAAVDCGMYASLSLRIVLEPQAGAARWTLYARFPGMPPDLVKAGDVMNFMFTPFDLVTPETTNHRRSIVLERNGTPVMFDAQRTTDLISYGITFEGRTVGPCLWTNCYFTWGDVVSYGGESKPVGPGQTVQIGALSFSMEGIDLRSGLCDGPETFEQMAGFTLP